MERTKLRRKKLPAGGGKEAGGREGRGEGRWSGEVEGRGG